jgi:MFS family permease
VPVSRPLGRSYPTAIALALLALSPYIVLSTAGQLLQPSFTTDLRATPFGLQLTDALANAGYAFGAVLAADLIQRLPARRLYVGCELGFVAGTVVCAAGSGMVTFAFGRIIQGLVTGMLLVAALPPLVTRFGVRRLPVTVAVIDLGLFGMVTLGPLVGGIAAAPGHWRLLFAVLAALAAIAAGLALIGFEAGEDTNELRFDWSAIPVALLATVLPFFGVATAVEDGFASPAFVVPVVAGLLALLFLLVRQYRKAEALMPLRLIAHTLPVTGIATAMVAGAGVTSLVGLAVVFLTRARHLAPAAAGLVLTTQVAGVILAAVLFSRFLRTRWLPAFALAGLGLVAVAAAVLLALSPANAVWLIAVIGLLLGVGAGAGVAPALFTAGLSAPSNRLGPTFALVELLRSEAAYLVAPVLLPIAMAASDLTSGVRSAALVVLVLCAIGGAGALAVLLLGGVRPHAPDLARWLDDGEPGYDSPPLAAAVRTD